MTTYQLLLMRGVSLLALPLNFDVARKCRRSTVLNIRHRNERGNYFGVTDLPDQLTARHDATERKSRLRVNIAKATQLAISLISVPELRAGEVRHAPR